MGLCISGLRRSRYLYLSLNSSFVLLFSSIGKGGTSDSARIRRDSARSSISPVARFSFTAPPRFSTVPVTATTNSLLSLPAFSKPSWSMLPFSKIICMIPERSRRSTKTSPPLLRAFCTHPIRVTLLPTISFVTSAHRHVLCSPCILSAMFLSSFLRVFFICLPMLLRSVQCVPAQTSFDNNLTQSFAPVF